MVIAGITKRDPGEYGRLAMRAPMAFNPAMP
jgi:hypothetical protein